MVGRVRQPCTTILYGNVIVVIRIRRNIIRWIPAVAESVQFNGNAVIDAPITDATARCANRVWPRPGARTSRTTRAGSSCRILRILDDECDSVGSGKAICVWGDLEGEIRSEAVRDFLRNRKPHAGRLRERRRRVLNREVSARYGRIVRCDRINLRWVRIA